MEINKTMDGLNTYSSLKGKEDLRFELYDWLKEKGLSARQALNLLSLTSEAIQEARRAEIDKITL